MNAAAVEPISSDPQRRIELDFAAATLRRSLGCGCAVAAWSVEEAGAASEDRPWFVADLGFGPHLAMLLDDSSRSVLHVLDGLPEVAGKIPANYAVSRHDACRCRATLADDHGDRAVRAAVPPPTEELTDLIFQLERLLGPAFGGAGVSVLEPEASATRVLQRALDEDRALGHVIFAPLTVGGRSAGTLRLSRPAPAFSVAELHQLRDVAATVAITVDASRRLSQLSHMRRIEAVLSEEAIAIASGTESRKTIGRRLDDLRVLLGASIIALVPVDCDPIVAKASTVSEAVERRLFDLGRAERGERLVFDDAGDSADPGAGSVTLLTPVRAGRHHVGMLAARRAGAGPLTRADREALSRMAELIALSWAWGGYQQHRVTLARLEERQRIADDLHDDVAQLLFAAQLQLDGILGDGLPEVLRTRVALTRDVVLRADEAIRGIVATSSRPLTTSLSERLYEVAVAVDEEFTMPVQVEISDAAAEAGGRVPRAIAETIVRVAREALVNAAKHAGHCRVSLSLDLPTPERLTLRVSDTGRREPARLKAQSHGLGSLRRHARRHGGWLRVGRGTVGGTVVTLTLPI